MLMLALMFRVSSSLVLLLFFGTVSAQFNFFDNMFGHGQQQQQQQQQQRSGASQWAAFSDSGAYFRLLALNFEITQHIFSFLLPLPLSRNSRLRSSAC